MAILIVENYYNTRLLLKELLEFYGHHILIARDAEHAIELFQANRDNIEAIILDTLIESEQNPTLNYLSVMNKIFELKPSAKVIFTSGMPETSVIRKLRETYSTISFVNKPFEQERLMWILEQ